MLGREATRPPRRRDSTCRLGNLAVAASGAQGRGVVRPAFPHTRHLAHILGRNGAKSMVNTLTVARHAPTSPQLVMVEAGDNTIAGDLTVPSGVQGLVVFAHGSGSGRHSPRNRAVAATLARAQFATLLVDLLTTAEERIDRLSAELRFDIPFLARRLTSSIDWASRQPSVADLPIGLFGASTGAAAALMSAAERPRHVRAVVSRGGRPDLAECRLEIVRAPTLLIVGGRDRHVVDLNQEALGRLMTTRRLEIVPGATHLFEEPGTLDSVAQLATNWFLQHLAQPSRSVPDGRLATPMRR